jgi:hypothetical protein
MKSICTRLHTSGHDPLVGVWHNVYLVNRFSALEERYGPRGLDTYINACIIR